MAADKQSDARGIITLSAVAPKLMPVAALRILVLASLLAAAEQSSAERVSGESERMVYNDLTAVCGKFQREATRAYAGKFRIVPVAATGAFAPARIKGHSLNTYFDSYQDPRGTRERQNKARVVCLFVIDANGRPIEPRVIDSNNQRVADAIVAWFAQRRWVPARFQGTPVASLSGIAISEGGGGSRDPRLYDTDYLVLSDRAE